jgi:tRNA nucleotidyltransferase (CCA-adding enzyme)
MEIITSHINTDMDALASMVAAQKLYPYAKMVFPGKLSKTVEEFMSLHKDTINIRTTKQIDLKKTKRLIIVDTKNPRRIGKIADILSNPELEVHIYDHHPWADGDVRGKIEIVEPIGATATLLVEQIKRKDIPLSSVEATVLALGIYSDTGSLIFNTTTPRDAAAVAFLLGQGANLSVIADFLGRPLTDEQKSLLKTLLVSAEHHLISGAKILIAKGTVDDFVEGLALLTHQLAEIEKLDAVFTVVMMEDRTHIVARSSIPGINTNEILSGFGGGGHAAAASATVKTQNIEEVINTLLKYIRGKVHPPMKVSNIMSSPVKTVPPEMTITEVNALMLRYGHTGMPVVQGDNMVGVISKRDVEKAVHHGLGHAPVKGYMTRNVLTVDPEMSVSEVQKIMIENDIGRLPVTRDGMPVGIVSRTDILRTMHEGFQASHWTIYSQKDKSKYVYQNLREALKRKLAPIAWNLLQEAGKTAAEMGYNVYTAGGIVRDALLGVESLDVDLVVEGNGILLARALSEKSGAFLRVHEKFGTAEICFPNGLQIDVATARVEFYEYPAALPEVESSSLKQDLYRRDFTINAMAVILGEERFGDLIDPFDGRDDLYKGLVRVLHNLSFVEDPTRILRALRFEQRYHMRIEQQTLSLLRRAVKDGMLERVSVERLWEELKHIMAENNPVKILQRLAEVEAWQYIFPGIEYWDIQPVLSNLPEAIALLKEHGQPEPEPWLPYWLSILHRSQPAMAENLCQRYNLSKRQSVMTRQIVEMLPDIVKLLQNKKIKLSEAADILLSVPVEAYALLLSLLPGDYQEHFLNLLEAMQTNKPCIGGEEIKKLGYRPGPIYKQVLDALRRARLDGQINSTEDEIVFVKEFLRECKDFKKGV